MKKNITRFRQYIQPLRAFILTNQSNGTYVSLVEERGYKYVRNSNDLLQFAINWLLSTSQGLPGSEEATAEAAPGFALWSWHCPWNRQGMQREEIIAGGNRCYRGMNKVPGRGNGVGAAASHKECLGPDTAEAQRMISSQTCKVKE